MRYIMMEVQVIIYIIASLSILYRYRSELKEMFSSIEKIKLSWLYLVLFGFLAAHLFHLSKVALTHLNETWRDILSVSTHLVSMFMAAIVVLKGLTQPELFSGISESPSGRKYKKTALSDEELERYSAILTSYMESGKPYLDPSLTLGDLARALKIPSHYVSQVLSLRLKENFYNFINRYRIEESKRILSDLSIQKKTVLEVLYEAGFNSKATFNMAFKKHTGMTPTEYVRDRRE
ncbi:MAG: helix-turn-helix domain-containing protein [Candidatus Aminicenantes bacterium]|nr:helix-turn-helix domain-containing protein [Candidatus Aminicenantes bacterium]MDH5705056.1 helix-turn-helix domain-containing protein [Candidatus Aminicenantes bacterium]